MKWLDRVIRDWRIRRALPRLAKAERVLDVGCGDGEICRRLAKRGVSGVGIDPRLAKRPDVIGFDFIAGNFPDASPEGEPFDAITMLAVLEHVPAGQKPIWVDRFMRGVTHACTCQGWGCSRLPGFSVSSTKHFNSV